MPFHIAGLNYEFFFSKDPMPACIYIRGEAEYKAYEQHMNFTRLPVLDWIASLLVTPEDSSLIYTKNKKRQLNFKKKENLSPKHMILDYSDGVQG